MMNDIKLVHTRSLQTGDVIVGTTDDKARTIDYTEWVSENRLDIHTTDGTVYPKIHSHTLWRLT